MNKVLIGLFLFLSSCSTMNQDSKYLWLEKIESPKALDWVKEESEETLNDFTQVKDFQNTQQRILERLESPDKLVYVSKHKSFVYNLWKDAKYPRGLWRRQKYSDYIAKKKNWETLIDLGELSQKDNKKWVFKGVAFFPDSTETCLVYLSDGGKDAHYIKEYSFKEKKILEQGWSFPEAKYSVLALNKDSLIVGSNVDPKNRTRSNYAKSLSLIKRGETKGKEILNIPVEHTALWTYTVESGDRPFHFVLDSVDFFSANYYLYDKNKLVSLPIPSESNLEGVFQNKIFYSINKDTVYNNQKMIAGSVYYVEKLKGGFGKAQLFFKPENGKKFFKQLASTQDYVFAVFQENVSLKAYKYKYKGKNNWVVNPVNIRGEVGVIDTDEKSNSVIYSTSDFLVPEKIGLYNLKTNKNKDLQKSKSYFNEAKFTSRQEWAVSDDGTKVPFYIVHKKNLKLDSSNPTIMYGYGGFNISLQPFYLKSRGPEWLEKGGTFVLANIRGGGEFGPSWHRAAQKENKIKSYQDFAAIAKRLFELRITSPEHLGIVGGSNGGLLVGASSMLYPELYEAVFCAVPLLDMLRYDRLLAGASWIPEYGDPKIKEEREILKTYSPFQNIKKEEEYPEIFFYTSTYDDRVHPAHARKMYKKMKDMDHDVVYYENSEGGHAGASNLKQKALMEAYKFTFFKEELF